MQIETHKVNGIDDGVSITVCDHPGQGGASNLYRVEMHGQTYGDDQRPTYQKHYIHFQEGPLAKFGPNGLTHEVLLAIVQHRLEGFQAGELACEENALALDAVKKALAHLKLRTEKRIARGVEGTCTI